MEHSCYRCGAQIEEGVAFCPNCNAPQIRVAAAENKPATGPLTPGTPGEVQPPAEPVDFRHPNYPAQAELGPGTRDAGGYGMPPQGTSADSIHWSEALPGALLAGIVIAVSWIIPFASFLLWPMAAGVLAVMLYLRRRPETALSGGAGARLGAIAGLFGFGLFAVMMAVDLLVMRGGGKLRSAMEQVIQQSAARSGNPEAQAMMQRFLSPEGVAVLITIVFIMFLLIFVIFGSIGGVLGANLVSKKRK